MVDYAYLLSVLYPDARWSTEGDDYDGITWEDESPAPSQAELDAAWPAVRDAAAWDLVRVERDRRLTACDWTQVADAPLTASVKQAWADYRQTLRDIPQDYPTPDDVIWPEAP